MLQQQRTAGMTKLQIQLPPGSTRAHLRKLDEEAGKD